MTWAIKMADARYDGYNEGFEKGISVGLTTGREEGISIGLATGREEGISIGLERGLEQGLERGAYQKALETAKSFLAEGLHPEIIARCTSLPLEAVLELAKTK